MYSRQQASQLRQQFWTVFGQYMLPVLSVEGLKINWVNYKTGEKAIYFRMNADHKTASIAIEINCKDAGLQALYFEQLVQLKTVLQTTLGEEWTWQLHTPDEHNTIISRIYTEFKDGSIFNREDWPKLISFFKPRIIALDEFWSNAKYAFELMH